MSVTIRQMQAFVAVARAEGFTSGARQLHLTQSAISLLVRDLETQLGLQLMDRTTRFISLTDAGIEFLQSAERILADVEHAVSNTKELAEKRRGRITIAATPLLAGTLLPNVIASFQADHPAVTVQLADRLTEQIIQMVQNGDADFGVGAFPSTELNLQRMTLSRHSLGAMVPSGSPLAKTRRNLTWADLEGQDMISLSHSSGFRGLIAPFIDKAGVSVPPKFEVGYLSTAIGLAEAGLGIAVVPTYVGLTLRSNRTRFRVLHAPLVYRDVELVMRPGRSLSPGAMAFRDALALQCERLVGGV